MRKFISILLATALTLTVNVGVVAEAVTTNFLVSASVPVATGASITASRVNSTNNVFSPVVGTSLSFDPMTFDAVNGIFLPDHYFVIDSGAIGGAGTPDIVVTYTEGTNPNSPGKGLGWHAAATFVRVQGTTEIPLTSHGPKKLLKDLAGEHITIAETVGGFFRMYLGVVTGDAATPTGGVPFSTGDRPGTYTGTLVVTATVP